MQPERTRLAWGRTSLGFLVNAGLLIRFAPAAHPPALAYGAAAVMSGGGLVVWGFARSTYPSRHRALAASQSVAVTRQVRAVWLTVTAGSLSATVAVVSALLAG